MTIPFSQHHLLTRLSILHCIYVPPCRRLIDNRGEGCLIYFIPSSFGLLISFPIFPLSQPSPHWLSLVCSQVGFFKESSVIQDLGLSVHTHLHSSPLQPDSPFAPSLKLCPQGSLMTYVLPDVRPLAVQAMHLDLNGLPASSLASTVFSLPQRQSDPFLFFLH